MSSAKQSPWSGGHSAGSDQRIVAANGNAVAHKPTKLHKKKTEESTIAAICTWIVDHQIGIAANLLLLLTLAHMSFPKARQYTQKFFVLNYYDATTRRYGIGWDDVYTVLFWITIFTGLRIILMDYIVAPAAEFMGVDKPKDRTRFKEQAWVLFYYVTSFSVGMYILYHSKYWLDLEYMWEGWPDRQMDGLMKWYYLVQFAIWLQSIFVLNIEEKRKDHYQMLTHHFVTCLLMFTSYGYHYHRVGNVILCTMDAVDIILPLAKILKYMKYQKTCDIAFGVFMVVWLLSRHVVYNWIVYSIFRDWNKHIEMGCYSGTNGAIKGPFEPPAPYDYLIAPFLYPEGVLCHTGLVQRIFGGMLVFLQGILIMWFTMAVRLAIKVVKGTAADDPRSDDDESDEMEMEDVEETAYERIRAKEVKQTHESRQQKASKMSAAQRGRRSHGTASGVSLPPDRKELLGRIGCDKSN